MTPEQKQEWIILALYGELSAEQDTVWRSLLDEDAALRRDFENMKTRLAASRGSLSKFQDDGFFSAQRAAVMNRLDNPRPWSLARLRWWWAPVLVLAVVAAPVIFRQKQSAPPDSPTGGEFVQHLDMLEEWDILENWEALENA